MEGRARQDVSLSKRHEPPRVGRDAERRGGGDQEGRPIFASRRESERAQGRDGTRANERRDRPVSRPLQPGLGRTPPQQRVVGGCIAFERQHQVRVRKSFEDDHRGAAPGGFAGAARRSDREIGRRGAVDNGDPGERQRLTPFRQPEDRRASHGRRECETEVGPPNRHPADGPGSVDGAEPVRRSRANLHRSKRRGTGSPVAAFHATANGPS